MTKADFGKTSNGLVFFFGTSSYSSTGLVYFLGCYFFFGYYFFFSTFSAGFLAYLAFLSSVFSAVCAPANSGTNSF